MLSTDAREDYSTFGCLIVIVLTHGGEKGILWASDTHFKTSDVWEPFLNCDSLRNKPKIFIFQVCSR